MTVPGTNRPHLFTTITITGVIFIITAIFYAGEQNDKVSNVIEVQGYHGTEIKALQDSIDPIHQQLAVQHQQLIEQADLLKGIKDELNKNNTRGK